jgi:hypothetical protein
LHAFLGDRTIADAMPDRLVHNAHKIALEADSTRKCKSIPANRPRAATR